MIMTMFSARHHRQDGRIGGLVEIETTPGRTDHRRVQAANHLPAHPVLVRDRGGGGHIKNTGFPEMLDQLWFPRWQASTAPVLMNRLRETRKLFTTNGDDLRREKIVWLGM